MKTYPINWEEINKKETMKTLSATDLAQLRRFVKGVLTVCEYDDTGVSDDLYDEALICAEILGVIWTGAKHE